MRNLMTVIDAMLEIIPSTEEQLILALNSQKTSLMFSAPELINFRWQEVASVLNCNIKVATEEWHYAIGEIFSGKKLDLIK